MFARGRIARLLVILLGTAVSEAQQRGAPPALQPAEGLVRTELAYPTGDRATSVLLLERVTPREVRSGADLEYQIRVTNLTRSVLYEVVLVEEFPPGFTPRASAPGMSRTPTGQGTWRWPRLSGGATAVIRVQGTAGDPTELRFCATVTFATGLCAATEVVQPKLTLAQSLPGEVVQCDPIPLRLVVRNTGTGTLRSVLVTDRLPDGLTLADGRSDFTIPVGDLAAGQSREYTVRLRAARTGEFENRAVADEAAGQRAEAAATVQVRAPVLALAQRGPSARYLGRVATFELTVQNTGITEARDVVLTNPLPAGADYVTADGGGQLTDRTVTWRLGTLAPRESRTLRLTIQPTAIGTLQNWASATAYCARATATADLEVRGIPAILLEVADNPDPIEVGADVTYRIEVTNQGSAVGTNIVVDCTLPSELQYVSAAGPAPFTIEGQTVRFAPLASLAPKLKITYEVTVKGAREADARIKVSLRSDQTSSPVEETESTHIY